MNQTQIQPDLHIHLPVHHYYSQVNPTTYKQPKKKIETPFQASYHFILTITQATAATQAVSITRILFTDWICMIV